MRLFNKAAIVGAGLIGGSIAQAIKKKGLSDEVIGVSRHKKSLLWAKEIGAIDRGSQDLAIIKHSDLVILAAPVNAIISLAPKISKIISKECIVSDVGSTKEKIVKILEKIFPNYVGSHPLAGSEKRGIRNADAELLRGRLCLLTPTKNTNRQALNKISLLWREIGAKTISLSPKAHDKILSFTSHLPHIAAFSLIDVMPKEYLKFSSNGLRDTTRIAASESGLWIDILLSNAKNIIKSIEAFQNKLSLIKLAIQDKDEHKLSRILKQAKKKRDRLD